MVGRRLTVVGALSTVAAVATSTIALAKAQPGDLDHSFGGTGVVKTRVNGMKGYAASVAVDRSHRIVAAGSGINGFQLARYMPNCELDPAFSGDGMASVPFRNIDPYQSTSGYSPDEMLHGPGMHCSLPRLYILPRSVASHH